MDKHTNKPNKYVYSYIENDKRYYFYYTNNKGAVIEMLTATDNEQLANNLIETLKAEKIITICKICGCYLTEENVKENNIFGVYNFNTKNYVELCENCFCTGGNNRLYNIYMMKEIIDEIKSVYNSVDEFIQLYNTVQNDEIAKERDYIYI